MPTWGRRCALEVRQDGDAALAQLAHHVESVALGQAEIEDDEIGLLAPEELDGRSAVGCLEDRVALRGEPRPQEPADRRLVIDDQDAHRGVPSVIVLVLGRPVASRQPAQAAPAESRRLGRRRGLGARPADACTCTLEWPRSPWLSSCMMTQCGLRGGHG